MTYQTLFSDACYIAEKHSTLTLKEVESILNSDQDISLPVWVALNALKEAKSGINTNTTNTLYRGVVKVVKQKVAVEPIEVKGNWFMDFVNRMIKKLINNWRCLNK